MMHYNFLILSWWTVIPNFVDSLSLLSRPTNRHVCLFHDYETVQGPYFSALFDSVFERTGYASKRMLVISTAPPVAEDHLDMMPATTRTLEKLENDLGLEACQRIFLSQYNPWSLLDKLDQFQPTILWIDNDSNAFGLRHLMKISGLDGIIQQRCDSAAKESAVLYVGQGAGSICAGATMSLARLRGDDPKLVPEPQFFGLQLLGPQRSIYFDDDPTVIQKQFDILDNPDEITILPEDRVFVFSQLGMEATSFVMNPTRRGMIESLQSYAPLEPLIEDIGGRHCAGEPAVDPSRRIQNIGDSEWF